MMFGLGKLGAVAQAVRRLFSPASLFSSGEQGVWYEPSLTEGTLFQDAAGTTPVTAVEQPVGLMLDKSKGLVLGPELVTNGTFDSNINGWSIGNAGASTLSWESGKLRITRATTGDTYPNARTTLTGLVVGRSYKIVSQTNNPSAIESYHAIAGVGLSVVRTTLSSKTLECVFTATAVSHNLDVGIWSISGSVGQYVEFDNISVRELPGNHAFQTTSASRPVLSARVNLLTKTEDFGDAAWSKSIGGIGVAPSVTANAGIAPDGTLTADRVQFNCADVSSAANRSIIVQTLIPIVSGVSYKTAIYIKAFDSASVGKTIRFVVEGMSSSESIISLTTQWQEVSKSVMATSTSANFLLEARGNYTTQTADVLIWGADLRVANDGVGLPPYQRVNTSTDYDTTGFPLYLRFDGIDDSLQTNSINFSSTDKMTVWAGVRKLSDAVIGVPIELSVNAGTNSGAFYFSAPDVLSPNYGVRSGGSIIPASSIVSGYAAPTTNTLTGAFDIANDSMVMRINAVQVVNSTADRGTGNFGNYPLYIGRRGGTTLPFNGRLHSLIVRGAQSTADQIAATETYVNGKTKAY